MCMNLSLFCSGFMHEAASFYQRDSEANLEETIKHLDTFLKDERDSYVMNQKILINKISEWKKRTAGVRMDFGKPGRQNEATKKLIEKINNYNTEKISHQLEKDIESESKLINSWPEKSTEKKQDTAFETCLSTMKLRYNTMITEGFRQHIAPPQKKDSDTQSPETVITHNNNNSNNNHFYELLKEIDFLFSCVENSISHKIDNDIQEGMNTIQNVVNWNNSSIFIASLRSSCACRSPLAPPFDKHRMNESQELIKRLFLRRKGKNQQRKMSQNTS